MKVLVIALASLVLSVLGAPVQPGNPAQHEAEQHSAPYAHVQHSEWDVDNDDVMAIEWPTSGFPGHVRLG